MTVTLQDQNLDRIAPALKRARENFARRMQGQAAVRAR
jgi:hypothetical protein